MSLNDKMVGLASSIRNVSGLEDKLTIDDMQSVVSNLDRVNLATKTTSQWQHMQDWNIILAVIPVAPNATYSASIEVKNVSSDTAALMYIERDKDNNYLGTGSGNGNITSDWSNNLALIPGDYWSPNNMIHKGTFHSNFDNTKYIEIRLAGSNYINVDYRKFMLNRGSKPFAYVSQYLTGGGAVNAFLKSLSNLRRYYLSLCVREV